MSKWFYLSFDYERMLDQELEAIDPADLRIIKRMELIPFLLESDARGMGAFIVRKFKNQFGFDIHHSEFRSPIPK